MSIIRLSREYLLEVSKGNVEGYSLVHKFGRNAAVSTTLVPVCDGGYYRTPTSPANLAVISDDADDSSSGTGAQQLTLQYLDSNFTEQVATIETNGTDESVQVISGIMRLYRAYVSRAGSYASQSVGSQQGTLTIREEGAGDAWASIPEVGTTGFGVAQSLIGCYTVPSGYCAYILSSMLTVDSNKSANLYFFQRTNANDVSAPYSGCMRIQNVYTGIAGGVHEIIHRTSESYPEMTDIGFMASAPTTADVSVEFELLLEQC